MPLKCEKMFKDKKEIYRKSIATQKNRERVSSVNYEHRTMNSETSLKNKKGNEDFYFPHCDQLNISGHKTFRFQTNCNR